MGRLVVSDTEELVEEGDGAVSPTGMEVAMMLDTVHVGSHFILLDISKSSESTS